MKRFLFLIPILFACQNLFAVGVQLTWDAPANSGCMIDSYSVYRSMQSGVYASKLGSTTTRSYLDNSVAAGSTYFYVIKAACGASEGPPSTEVSAVIPASNVLPAPTGLTATCAADAKSVTVSWQPVSGAESYYLRFKDANGVQTNYDQYVPTSKVQTITPNLDYEWWVHAYSSTAGTFDPNWGAGIGPTQTPFPKFRCDTSISTPPPPTNIQLQIVFLAPPPNSTLNRGTNLVTLQASLNAVRVQFFVNNALKATNPQNSLNYQWFNQKKGNYTLKGVAFDISGAQAQVEEKVRLQ